ncbi:hypothetical protein [Kutzneria kofuensis]|uniref:hypothetical protein n=1 Tax=Kutzneria kofuensis TaxID=103725 RepID=UPI003CD05810
MPGENAGGHDSRPLRYLRALEELRPALPRLPQRDARGDPRRRRRRLLDHLPAELTGP